VKKLLAISGTVIGLTLSLFVPSPVWRADGKELIFSAPNGSPMAVDVSANGVAFQPGVCETFVHDAADRGRMGRGELPE
jgi:hypothetical protein